MPKLFLSYRRADSAGWVRAIDKRLSEEFGRDNVFRDIASIPPGADFLEALKSQLRECDILLVIIGQMWTAISGKSKRRRLLEDDDLVRQEIEMAIDLDLWVIPVLVGHANLPPKGQLPETLHALTERQAYELTEKHFDSDLDDLVRALHGLAFQRKENQAQVTSASGPAANESAQHSVSADSERLSAPIPDARAAPIKRRQSSLLESLSSLISEDSPTYQPLDEAITPTVLQVSRTGDRWTFVLDRPKSDFWFGYSETSSIGHSVLDAALRNLSGPLSPAECLELGELLYQLLVPKRLREFFEGSKGLRLKLDLEADRLPWEFLKPKGNALPLGLSQGVIREFSDIDATTLPTSSSDDEESLVLVGAMDYPFVDLPGARKEADEVASLLNEAGLRVKKISDVGAFESVRAVCLSNWRIVHLVGHGVFHWAPAMSPTENESSVQITGLMIERGVALSIAEVLGSDQPPQVLTVGAMNLTSWAAEALRGGCRVFVTIGPQADDAATCLFFSEFYRSLTQGASSSWSCLKARRALAHGSPDHLGTALWVRAYGDGGYHLSKTAQQDAAPERS